MEKAKLQELLDKVSPNDHPKIIKKDKVKWNTWTELFDFYNAGLEFPTDMNNPFSYGRVYMNAVNYIYE